MDSLSPLGAIRVRSNRVNTARGYFSTDDDVMIDFNFDSSSESGLDQEKLNSIRIGIHSELRKGAPVKKRKRHVKPTLEIGASSRLKGKQGKSIFPNMLADFDDDDDDDEEFERMENEILSGLLPDMKPSAFRQVLEDPEKMKQWEPFVSITMERQEILLKEIDPEKQQKRRDIQSLIENDSPAERYGKIDREIRINLKKQPAHPLISKFEQDIINYVNSNPKESLKYNLSDPFHRMLLHGVCQYMFLHSKSVDTENGRETIVSLPSNVKEIKIPKILLSKYLQQNTQQQKPYIPKLNDVGIKKKKKHSNMKNKIGSKRGYN